MAGCEIVWCVIMFVASVIVAVIVGFIQKAGLIYRLRHKVCKMHSCRVTDIQEAYHYL